MKRGEGMNDEVERINLAIKTLEASVLFDCDPQNIELEVRYRVEFLAYQLRAALSAPAQVLQEDRVICTYPDGWWQAIRARLGWRHRQREVKLKEWLLFPKIGVPKWTTEGMTVHYTSVSDQVEQ